MEYGVELKRFHTDNGIFKSKAFVEALKDNYQMIIKSGVGAHHQNGVAERAIGTVQAMARAMLLHVRFYIGPMNSIHYCGPSLSTTLSKFTTTCRPRSRMGCVQKKYLQASFLTVAHSNNYWLSML